MNFLAMQQALSDQTTAFDYSVAADATKLKRYINRASQEIAGTWDWPFLRKLDIIQTVADYTTGTVSVSSGGTTITFSAGPSVSLANRFIKFSSTDNWYQITAHTASALTATIDPAYGPSSALSSGTFTVRKIYYGIDSTMDNISDVKLSIDSGRLISLSPIYSENALSFLGSSGRPEGYGVGVPTSAGLPQLFLFPTPDDVYNLYVSGKKRVEDMTSDSDEPLLPTAYHNVILDLASFYVFSKLDDTRAKTFYEKHALGLEQMKAAYTQDAGRNRVMRAIDSGSATGAVFTLPSQYGPMSYD
jgi:hypothetical protein